MSSAEDKQKIDDDILQCKADILRASSAGASKPNNQKSTRSEDVDKPAADSGAVPIAENRAKTGIEESDAAVSTVKPKKTLHDIIPGSAGRGDKKGRHFEIPKFDLAEDILSEHRKIIAQNRRKSSTATRQAVRLKEVVETKEIKVPRKKTTLSQTFCDSRHRDIISQIVAKDIGRQCKGEGEMKFFS